jgi:FHS family L-fucose permease-like MFS transporter
MKKQPGQSRESYATPLYTLTTLFFMWGFITCMNDILIPHLKELFRLNYLQSMLVQFCFFGAYFTGSLIYFLVSHYFGDPINKIGYRNGILLGLVISAAGCALFYPAATLSVYALFLAALFVLGLGFTLLQIAANPYVSLLGEESGASARLNLAQAFNSAGTTIAPVAGGFLIFEFFSENGGISPAATRIPYLIFGLAFLFIGLLIYKVKLPEFKTGAPVEKGLGALRFPQLRLGILAIFFYVGAEVAIGSFMISFLSQPHIMGLEEHIAKNYLALYWGGAMIGRFLGAISLSTGIPAQKKPYYMAGVAAAVFLFIYFVVALDIRQMSPLLIFMTLNLAAFFLGRFLPALTLLIFSVMNICLLLAVVCSSGAVAMWSLIGIGLFNSIMWSNIFTLSITGLGIHTSQGASLLVMAILGGAVIPLVQGGIADLAGIRYSFLLPLGCYCYIVYFGWYCRKKEPVAAQKMVMGGH